MAISLAPECRHDESSQYITKKKYTIDDAIESCLQFTAANDAAKAAIRLALTCTCT